MSTLVSIVIPVYNVEKYIEKCINSLLAQTYQNLEIILIDDGSNDNSLILLQRYAETDERIKLFQQKNQGAAIARNYGLRVANGNYVIFLDSDDYFDEKLIELSVKKAEKYDADITIFQAEAFDNVTGMICPLNDKIKKSPQYLNETFCYKNIKNDIFNSFLIAPWNKLYKKSFLDKHKFEFQNIKRTNDLLFTSETLVKANKIILLDEILVHYRTGLSSNLQSGNQKTPLEFYKALYELKRYLEKNKLYVEVEKSYQKMVFDVFCYNLNSLKTKDKFNEVITFFRSGGFKELGLSNYENIKSLSIIEYLQYRLVMSNIMFDKVFLLRNLYKVFKISQYIEVVGIIGLLKKIKLNFVVKRRK